MSTTIKWHFAIQRRNGNAHLHTLTLSPQDNGPLALSKLRDKYNEFISQAPYKFWDRPRIFWSPAIEVAELSEYSAIDTEAQIQAQRVIIVESTPDAELTECFRHPELLSAAANFLQRNERFANGEMIFLIRQKVNFCGVCVLAIVGMLFCVGVGVVVGIWSEKTSMGVAVTSGLATVVACVEALRFRAYR